VTFQIGDKVIYPNHGLGVVERIEEKTILGTTCGFYHLKIVASDTTVLVPLSNVDGVGLRRAISDDEVQRLFGCWETAGSTITRIGRGATRTIPTRCAPARSSTWPTC
jgi:RNA polymerase-interacting CarD/CdnL/TRCF family regulator